MPLSKARDRERKRKFQPNSNLNDNRDFQPKLEILRQLIKSIENKSVVQPTEDIPLYNPALHRSGDTVRIRKGERLITTRVPLLDAEGQVIPDYGD